MFDAITVCYLDKPNCLDFGKWQWGRKEVKGFEIYRMVEAKSHKVCDGLIEGEGNERIRVTVPEGWRVNTMKMLFGF